MVPPGRVLMVPVVQPTGKLKVTSTDEIETCVSYGNFGKRRVWTCKGNPGGVVDIQSQKDSRAPGLTPGPTATVYLSKRRVSVLAAVSIWVAKWPVGQPLPSPLEMERAETTRTTGVCRVSRRAADAARVGRARVKKDFILMGDFEFGLDG